MILSDDYKVLPRSEADIKRLANRCRQLAGIDGVSTFNIVGFLRRCFCNPEAEKGKLLFAIVPEWHPKEVPYVEYSPLTLVTTQRILNRAELGMPFERFQLAHEVGHIVMHDNHAKAFSLGSENHIKFEEKYYSAEWQANTFAKYFLLPDWILFSDRSYDQILSDAQILQPMLDERLNDIKQISRERLCSFEFEQRQFRFDF